jgi:hypothetical protein
MSSADLNNGSSDFRHPQKADAADELTRIYGGLTPRVFFGQLVEIFHPAGSLQAERERASFLYRRMREYRRYLWICTIISMLLLMAPLLCLISPADLGPTWFVCGLAAEGLAVLAWCYTHQKWISCRRDYTRWLRLVHRRVAED